MVMGWSYIIAGENLITFHVSSKFSSPRRPCQLPAAGRDGPRQVTKTSSPQYSFTGRGPSIFDDTKRTPGPSKYGTVDPNVYMARAPRCTMAGRSRPPPASNTPGPSDYNPKEGRKQGQTFGIRYPEAVVPMMDSHL
ncbi:hypothetical protein DUI87_33364 [Hirundo rustica rustica]|uniref:Outer dense fiber protein 3-like protein 2 n=1 Tax=Hirundo rustica rustica TaxID=333673 RepID=A0A3M0IPE3_HIRRU|nr:hypothetical protein DUI87_33364 [Hirundo rustica rustica]